MFRSLKRTILGPSSDPRMSYISRPLPRGLPDEQVLAALDLAFAENPDPAYLVETLPGALRQVTGKDYQVLDRSARDVTGAFSRTMVMVRDGDVGHWLGYDAMSYPLLAPSAKAQETLAAITAAEGGDDQAAQAPTAKPGWEPPPPIRRERPTSPPS